MRHYTLALALSTSLLAGCGGAAYDKPGLTYAEWKRDDAACRLAAGADAAPDRESYASCMRARGYRLRAE